MPIFEYKGQRYELPEGTSKEAALTKIKKHLASAPEEEFDTKEHLKDAAATVGSSLLGPGFAAVYGAHSKPKSKVGRMNKAAMRDLFKSASLGYYDSDKRFKPRGAGEKAAGVAGTLAGYALPLGVAGKAVKAAGFAGKGVAPLKAIAGQAGLLGGLGAIRKPEKGESRATNALIDAIIGGAFGTGGQLIKHGGIKGLKAAMKPSVLDSTKVDTLNAIRRHGRKVYKAALKAGKTKEQAKELQGEAFEAAFGEAAGPDITLKTGHKLKRGLLGRPSKLGDIGKTFFRNRERASRTDLATGGRNTEVWYKLDRAQRGKYNMEDGLLKPYEPIFDELEKMKVSGDTIQSMMAHVEQTPKGIIWNAAPKVARNGAILAPAMESPKNPRLMELLGALRTIETQQAQAAGITVDPRYAMQAFKVAPKMSKKGAKAARAVQIQVAKMRTGKLEKMTGVKETDYWNLKRRWVSEVANKKNVKPIYKEVQNQIWELDRMGMGDEANNLAEASASLMGAPSGKAARRILSKEFVDASAQAIDDMVAEVGGSKAFSADLRKLLFNQMYGAFIGMNPKLIAANQALQVDLVAPAWYSPKEIWRAKGWVMSKKGQEILNRPEVINRLYAFQTDWSGHGREAISNATMKRLDKLGKIGSKWGMKLFSFLDHKVNRGQSFGLGYLGVEEAYAKGGAKAVAKHIAGKSLTAGEKRMVLHALKTKGIEEAKLTMGEIMTHNINYSYGSIDKPEFLRKGLGKWVPFVTWGSNQAMRIMTDLENNNVKALAKRLAVPLFYIMAFEGITGYESPTKHPMSSAFGAFPTTVAPSVAGVLEGVRKKDVPAIGRQAQMSIPLGKLFKIGSKVAEKGLLEGGLNIKKKEKN